MDSISDASLFELTEQVAACLQTHHLRLVTAESCTGGWVAKCCTDLAGSSVWFERGFVTYSNEAKQSELNVAETTLIQHGAVSAAVVEEMAQGALAASHANISVSISGIAGPDGGSKEKPVGTVWIAWGQTSGPIQSQCFHFSGDRDQVRRQAVYHALQGILKNASE